MTTSRDIFNRGRLTARPENKTVKEGKDEGLQLLSLDAGKDGLIYIPKGYKPGRPASFALMLHGAGGDAKHGLSYLRNYADSRNMILLAPASGESTWDIIAGRSFNRDVILIDQALSLVFDEYAIDPEHVAIGGFSDGASYALSLGLSNGDLFSHILAFSPGFFHVEEKHGKPKAFISHGTRDQVLPVEPCSRRIVPQLLQFGNQVNYHEFEGAHEIPSRISGQAVEWFLAG